MDSINMDGLYSVASTTWNHFVWIDLSLLYDCPAGIKLKTALKGYDILLIDDESPQQNSPYNHTAIFKDHSDQWLEWQSKATAHSYEYDKKYGKN